MKTLKVQKEVKHQIKKNCNWRENAVREELQTLDKENFC